MTPRRLGLLVGLAALAAAAGRALAVDKHDTFEKPTTIAVGLTGGDTNGEYSVSCSSNPAVQLRPAVTDRSRRKICFQNQGSVTVAIGSSTVVASLLWNLGESTNTATSPMYCTNSSSAWNCAAKAGAAAQTVIVLEETQSIP